jgi:hypothetical protein
LREKKSGQRYEEILKTPHRKTKKTGNTQQRTRFFVFETLHYIEPDAKVGIISDTSKRQGKTAKF